LTRTSGEFVAGDVQGPTATEVWYYLVDTSTWGPYYDNANPDGRRRPEHGLATNRRSEGYSQRSENVSLDALT